jgi:DNA-binding transcriptional MerR regulator
VAESHEKELYRIGEVSRLTATKAFVLRYWETEFPMLQPAKSPKGQRLYRRQDIETVLEIKRLLYEEGFTIAGARRHLREAGTGGNGSRTGGRARFASAEPGEKPRKSMQRMLAQLREELRAILTLLERG